MSDWTVEYYETGDGRETVLDEMRSFGSKEAARIVRTIGLLEEFGLSLSGSYVKHIRGEIWELRATRFRVLYFTFTGRKLVMLRAFMKKSRTTPKSEIAIPERRMNDYTSREGE